jgi:hypothetical protein
MYPTPHPLLLRSYDYTDSPQSNIYSFARNVNLFSYLKQAVKTWRNGGETLHNLTSEPEMKGQWKVFILFVISLRRDP